jgi:hypothetical protein
MTNTSDNSLRVLGTQIVVIDSGFVCYGEVTHDLVHNEVLISNCKNVRVWGTTQGLGELRNGPTKKTVLDEEGECLVPYARIIRMIPAHW